MSQNWKQTGKSDEACFDVLIEEAAVAPLHVPNFSHYFAGACVECESAA